MKKTKLLSCLTLLSIINAADYNNNYYHKYTTKGWYLIDLFFRTQVFWEVQTRQPAHRPKQKYRVEILNSKITK